METLIVHVENLLKIETTVDIDRLRRDVTAGIRSQKHNGLSGFLRRFRRILAAACLTASDCMPASAISEAINPAATVLERMLPFAPKRAATCNEISPALLAA
jgi:hypothetical protein